MSHPRKVARDAVKTLLTGKTSCGTGIYTSRIRPFSEGELPAINVYCTDEDADHKDTAPRCYERTAVLNVEILAKADDGLDDVLDAVALQVETVLLSDPSWGGAVDDSEYTGASMDLVTDGNTLHGSCKLTFNFDYLTEQPDASGLDDFKTADTKYDLAEADGEIEAEDKITLPTE